MGFFRWCIYSISVLIAISYPQGLFGGDFLLAPPASYPSEVSQGKLRDLVKDQNFRAAIGVLDQCIREAHSAEARAFLLVEKAKVLYADQQQMEAQEVFLDALQTLPSPRQPVVSEAEQQAFASFFSRYVESTQSPDECSRLLADTKALVHSHPEFASVEYYSAACCANRGRFIEFFDLFFHAFQSRPDCFLNWKTQGVMHLRLFEASSSEERREIHRQAAVRCLKAAFTRQPQDSTVLVKLAFLLPPHEKVDLLKSVTAELIRLEAPIRRSDCFFLIQQAMEAGELEVAKQLLDKARSWYEYSRTINELSDQLAGVHKQGTVGK